MSGKGTDADLLNIASTAQGDLYYNNGSAIARLGAGTSGQALLTGGTGANPSWGDVGGGILQFKQIVKTNKFSTTSTNFTDVTGLTGVTITPTSASNKILINITGLAGSVNTDRTHIRLVGTTSTAIGDDVTGHEATTGVVGRSGDDWHQATFAINFLDAPNSTSQQTYKLQMKSNGGGATINSAYGSDGNVTNGITTFTVMEIASGILI